MSYTIKTIPLETLYVTDKIPDFVGLINSNNLKLKSNIEDLYNNLKISTSNIGSSTDSITSIFSKSANIMMTTDDHGLFFNKNGVLNGYIKTVDNLLTASFNKLIITDLIETSGALSVGSSESKEQFTVYGTSTLSGGSVTSYVSDPITVNTMAGGIATVPVILTKTGYSEIILNIKLGTSLYTGGARVSGFNGIVVDLRYSSTSGDIPVPGQDFTLILGDIVDSNGTNIGSNISFPSGVKLKCATTPSSKFLNNNNTLTEYVLVADNTAYYSNNLSFSKIINAKIITHSSNNKILIKNI
jgi:hypothetical protein